MLSTSTDNAGTMFQRYFLVRTRCEHRESSRLVLEIVRFLATHAVPAKATLPARLRRLCRLSRAGRFCGRVGLRVARNVNLHRASLWHLGKKTANRRPAETATRPRYTLDTCVRRTEQNDRDHPVAMCDLTISNPHTKRRSAYIALF